jgi:hypothetical protein
MIYKAKTRIGTTKMAVEAKANGCVAGESELWLARIHEKE